MATTADERDKRRERERVRRVAAHQADPNRVKLGDRFGSLTVTGSTSKVGVLCRCECGRDRSVAVHHLRGGRVTDCGICSDTSPRCVTDGCKLRVRQLHVEGHERPYAADGLCGQCHDRQRRKADREARIRRSIEARQRAATPTRPTRPTPAARLVALLAYGRRIGLDFETAFKDSLDALADDVNQHEIERLASIEAGFRSAFDRDASPLGQYRADLAADDAVEHASSSTTVVIG